MEPSHFISLPDIVFLEIFSYLSCEDVLYAFADLQESHLIDLISEHGAFRQICLSSQLSRRQYKVLSNGIWRYNLVRSFICKEMFSDFANHFAPCQIFPSLTELRILYLRCVSDDLSPFIISHSSTLTHFSITRSEQSFILEDFQTLLYTILPHLNQLKLLDNDWRSHVSIQWSRLENCLQSLEHLFTYVETMSDVYELAVDGFFPRLQSLRIYVNKSVIKTVSSGLPAIAKLRMPTLETFNLYLKQRGQAGEGEEQVQWTTLETLTSHSVMPRLRRYSLIYSLQTSVEIRHIFQSSLFHNDERNIDVRFGLYLITTTPIDSSDATNIRSVRYNNSFVQYNDEDKSKFYYNWFTSSWPSWMTFWMGRHGVVPRSGIRHLGIKAPNFLIHSIGKLFSDADELMCLHPGSLSMVGSSLAPSPLINLRRLIVEGVIPGLELLLDGSMLPRLHTLNGLIVPLFVAFARRENQMKTLDTIEQLEIADEPSHDERCFSFKQWHIVLDTLPRLRTLIIQIHNPKCPPIGMADLFVDYLRQTTRAPFTLFSCCIDHCNNADNKEHFIEYLEKRIKMVCYPVQFVSIGPTRLDAWM